MNPNNSDDEQEITSRRAPPPEKTIELKYNTSRARIPTRHVFIPKDRLLSSSLLPVKLVPIRLDIDLEQFKLKDAFTWNLNEVHITPERFANIYADDIDSPFSQQLVSIISTAIRDQCSVLAAAVEEDFTAEFSTPESIEEEEQYNDIRIVIKLDITIGNMLLNDQFEWPLFTAQTSPEEFSYVLCADLGIGGEFVPFIAHAIRDQVCNARLNFEDATGTLKLSEAQINKLGAPDIKSRALRPIAVEDDWEPELRELTEFEIEKILKEKERSSRRLRRSQKFTPFSSSGRNQANVAMNSNSRQTRNAWRVPSTPSVPQSYIQQHQRVTHRNYQPTPEEMSVFQQYNNAAQQNPNARPNPNQQLPNGMSLQQYQHQQQLLQQQQQSREGFNPNQYQKFPPQGNLQPQPHPGLQVAIKRKTSVTIDPELVSKQVELMRQGSASPTKRSEGGFGSDGEHAPPRVHRGFGASAGVFNQDGALDIGGFRKGWRCSWCLLNGKFTPTLRKGPLGTKTLCNACGIWFMKHGSLPEDRYHEHVDTV